MKQLRIEMKNLPTTVILCDGEKTKPYVLQPAGKKKGMGMSLVKADEINQSSSVSK